MRCRFLGLTLAVVLVAASPAQTRIEPTEAVVKLLDAASHTPLKDRPAAFEAVAVKAHTLGDREGEGFGLELAGVMYLNLSAWANAADRLKKALAIMEKIGDRKNEAAILDHLGAAYAHLGEGSRAVDMYRREFGLAETQKNEPGQAIALNNLGNVLVDLGRLVEAQAAYEAALVLDKKQNDPRSTAITLFNLGEICRKRSDPVEALGFYEKTLPVFREIKDQPAEANTLRAMAEAHSTLGDSKTALSELSSALTIWTSLGVTSGVEMVRATLARFYLKSGDLAKARDQLELCMTELKTDGNLPGQVSTLLEFSHAESELGDNAQALEAGERALTVATMLGEPHIIASALVGVGQASENVGQRARALDAYKRALKLLRGVGDRDGQARALTFLGGAYTLLCETDKAFACLNEALQIDRSLGAVSAQASDENDLAVCYNEADRPADALKSAQRALALWTQVGDQQKAGLAYNTIGNAYLQLGQFAQAIGPLQQALAIAVKTGDTASEAVWLNNLASCEEQTGPPAEALATYGKALALERKLGDLDDEAVTCSNLLKFFETQQASGLAVLNGKLAVNLFQSLRKGAAGAGASTERTYRDRVAPTYRELAGVLARMGRLAEAEQVIGLLKDSEFNKFLETRSATGSQNVNLTALESAWAQKYDGVFKEVAGLSAEYDALARIGVSERTPANRERLKAIDARFEACNAALEAYFVGAREAFAKANAVESRIDDLQAATGLTAVLKALPGHPAAIYTFVTEDGVHLLLNLPNGSVYRQPVKNLPAAELNEKILTFRQALQDPRVDPRPLGADLYELIVRPIEQDLIDGKIDSLMWSLDSRLRYVPLWALYDSKAAKFLIEKYPSSLFTPRTVERQIREVHPSAWQGVEFGVSLGRTVGSLQFGALPGVPRELKAVSGQVGGEPKMDKDFTRDAFEEALSAKPKIVHIATHFNFIPGDEKDSYMLLGTSELSVEEFKRLRNGSLDGVELLALSACDTANGDIRATAADGGEFESFALLAQLKGADSVLASLWPVNDSSTSLLMGEFYRLRKAHPEWTKLEALRQAQLGLLAGRVSSVATTPGRAGMASTNPLVKNLPAWPGKGFSHPFYWAPFELIGNWK